MTSAVNEKGKDEYQGGAKGNDEIATREGEREKKRVDKLARERINEREREIKRQCNREWKWMGSDGGGYGRGRSHQAGNPLAALAGMAMNTREIHRHVAMNK